MSKGWGGKQPKLRTTEMHRHEAVPPTDICRHPRGRTLCVGTKVKAKGWWSTSRHKWRQGTVTKLNDDRHEWNNNTYQVTFDEPIEHPQCFTEGSCAPVSKYGGRGSPPDTHVGHAKGMHQLLWERGMSPAVLPRNAGITSNNRYKSAILKFLEDEGRVAARHHDPYCSVCSVYNEEEDVTTCPPGPLIDCTFCNHARHVHKCAKLPKHIVQAFDRSGKIPGAWACQECIAYARDELGLDPPENVVSSEIDVNSDSSDEDDGDDGEADGIVLDDVSEDSTELDMEAVDGLVFGKWSVQHMRMLVAGLPDFKAQKSRIHEVIEARGHICLFLPKFHCEMNYIELYWCLGKWHTRGRADMSWKGLKHAIWEAFGVVAYDNPSNKALPTSSIVRQRESRRTREYIQAYEAGACVTDVDEMREEIKKGRKSYLQHRTPSQRGARETVVGVRRYRCSVCGGIGHNKNTCTHTTDV